MKTTTYILLTVTLLLIGCKENSSIVEPSSKFVSYSGQYHNVFYNSGSIEPTVTLNLVQDGSKLSGTGYFNNILFNFTGTLSENHAIITFDLLNTNAGDLKNCFIDGFFGPDYILAGGYTLSYVMGTERIKFSQVQKAQ